jgi:hypothetical protein
MQQAAAREALTVSEIVRRAVTEKLLRDDVKQRVQETDAERAEREFLRKAAQICASPDELRKALRAIEDEDERNNPETREYLDAQRNNSKSPRQRALAGRFRPKP